jgi:DNA-binding protein
MAKDTSAKDPNTIYIGNKPPMNYVMAVITGFNMSNADEVTLKARGRAISTAVDVAEIVRSRFLKEVKVHAISIGTERTCGPSAHYLFLCNSILHFRTIYARSSEATSVCTCTWRITRSKGASRDS